MGQTRDLVGRAQTGDRQAFNRLVDRFEGRLRSLIRLRLGSRLRKRVELDDVFQETCLRAFQSIHRFEWRGNGSFFRWLAGIAEHVILQLSRHYFQTQKRTVPGEISLSVKSPVAGGSSRSVGNLIHAKGTPPSAAVRRFERFERLESALKKLAADYREVIILARVSELPIKEIAERMGRSSDAVSMLLLRALRQLREHFGSTDSLGLPLSSLETLTQRTAGGEG